VTHPLSRLLWWYWIFLVPGLSWAATTHSGFQRSRVSAYDFHTYAAPRIFQATQAPQHFLSGHFELDSRFRASGDFQDQDLSLRYHLEKKIKYDSKRERKLLVSGRMDHDLDGISSTSTFPFRDLGSSSGQRNQFYEFYFEGSDSDRKNLEWKIGRQFLFEQEFLWLDGFLLRRRDHPKLLTSLFGGEIAKPWSAAARERDRLIGINSKWDLNSRTRVNLLFLHNRERTLIQHNLPSVFREINSTQNLIKSGIHWQASKRWKLRAGATQRDGSLRDWRVSGQFLDTHTKQRTLDWEYSTLAKSTDLSSRNFEALGFVTAALLPFEQVRIQVGQSLDEGNYTLTLSYLDRFLRDSTAQGLYNREFSQSHASLHAWNWIENGSVLFSTSLWDSISNQSHHGVEVTYKPEKRTELGLGTYYSVYKVDYLLGRENLASRNYYLELSRRLAKGRFRISFEKEFGLEDFITLRTRWTREF
jgi:hypothetical protein